MRAKKMVRARMINQQFSLRRLIMKFYQEVTFCLYQTFDKVSISFRHKWRSYDVIKITTWCQKLTTAYLRQKWRNILKTLQNLLLCHNDVFCKCSSIFDHPFLFHKNTLSLKTTKTGKYRCCRLRLSTAKYIKHVFENHFAQMWIP